MFKTLFRKNYSRIIQTITKSENDFRRPEELVEAVGLSEDCKLVHTALVKRLLTAKSQTTRVLTIKLWKWLLAKGTFEFRNHLVLDRTYVTATIREMQDPVIENEFMEMITETAALFKNEPGLQHMLEFTPGNNGSSPQFQNLTEQANADPNNPIFSSFASSTNDAIMSLKQVQKHVEITLTACDMLVEALNFNEGPIGDNELVKILYQQLKTFKSANDRWIEKNNVSEQGLDMLLTCNDKILSAVALLKRMIKESEISSFPSLQNIAPPANQSYTDSGDNMVNMSTGPSLEPASVSNQASMTSFIQQTSIASLDTGAYLSYKSLDPSLEQAESPKERYEAPEENYFVSKLLPSTQTDSERPLDMKDSSEMSHSNSSGFVPPSEDEKIFGGVERDLKNYDDSKEKVLESSNNFENLKMDEILPAIPSNTEPLLETTMAVIEEPNADIQPTDEDNSSENLHEISDRVISSTPVEETVVEIAKENGVDYEKKVSNENDDDVVSSEAASSVTAEEAVEVISEPVSVNSSPTRTLRESSPSPDSSNSPSFGKAEIKNSKRYFFNHPPKAWTDLQDIKATMAGAFQELSKVAEQMESHYSDRTTNAQVYIAKGRKIHDLAQFAIDHWEPSVKYCRNPMVKKDLDWSFQQMEAMRGVLAVLLKRKISDVKEGDDGHLLSSCKDLKIIFDSAVNNLIAYELTKEQ